jgi:hypothetical protein
MSNAKSGEEGRGKRKKEAGRLDFFFPYAEFEL